MGITILFISQIYCVGGKCLEWDPARSIGRCSICLSYYEHYYSYTHGNIYGGYYLLSSAKYIVPLVCQALGTLSQAIPARKEPTVKWRKEIYSTSLEGNYHEQRVCILCFQDHTVEGRGLCYLGLGKAFQSGA